MSRRGAVSPNATICPTISCPRIVGAATGRRPSKLCRSLPQSVQPSTRTRISAAAGSGVGIRRSSSVDQARLKDGCQRLAHAAPSATGAAAGEQRTAKYRQPMARQATETPLAIQQASTNTIRKFTCSTLHAEGEQDNNRTQVADGIGHVHQKADVAAVAGHRQQSLEDRGVHCDIGQVQPQADQHHEGKIADRALPAGQ